MFETEFTEASTSENASGMSHRYPGSHSSHCLGSQKPVLISGGPPGWGGPGSSLLRMTRSVPVGSASPVGLYPAPSHRMSPQLFHVEYRIQGPPTVWMWGSTSPGACHKSTLTSSEDRRWGGRVNCSRHPSSLTNSPILGTACVSR